MAAIALAVLALYSRDARATEEGEGAGVLVVHGDVPQVEVARYIYVLRETTEARSFADVRSPAAPFVRNRKATPGFGYSTTPIWVRLTLKNEDATHDAFFLKYDYPSMQSIEAYIPSGAGPPIVYRTGKNHPFAERPLSDRDFIFPIHIAKGASATVYMRFETAGSVQVPLSLLTPEGLHSASQIEYLLMGVYYGFAALMFLYSLSVAGTTGDRSYLLYSLYVLSVLLLQMSLHGVSYQLLWPRAAAWNRYASILFVGTTFALLSLFTRTFLETARRVPRLSVVLNAYGAAAAAVAVLAPVAYGSRLIRAAGLLTVLLPLVTLPVAVGSLRSGSRPAKYYLFAIVFYILGACAYGMKDAGVLPSNVLTEDGIVIGSLLELALFSLGLADKMRMMEVARREREAELREVEVKNRRNEAVAQTTQMLAHDVRRPLGMVQVGIDAMLAARSPAELRQTAMTLVPEIRAAAASVDSLLTDVIEVGSVAPPQRESISTEAILERALREVAIVHPNVAVRFSYDLSCRKPLCVDAARVQRVFTNILSNALRATKGRGRIWFQSRLAPASSMAELVVGNDGPPIPEADLPLLFDPFFTRNAKGGTGLGLAIARKVVVQHGGAIACSSSAAGVEFRFTLPTAPGEARASAARLPSHGRDLGALARRADDRAPLSDAAGELEARVLAARGPEPLHVLVVEDEAAYVDVLRNQLRPCVEAGAVTVATASDGASLARALEQAGPDLVLMDLDLRDEPRGGIALVREMRARGHRGVVCIHSHRALTEPPDTGGADCVIPKPMDRARLLALVLRTLEGRSRGARERP